MAGQRRLILLLFLMALTGNTLFWLSAYDTRAVWSNVPPVPTEGGVVAMALGDRQLAYRITGFMLQNLGDSGDRTTPLQDYDYDRLVQWFYLADRLDPASNFVPLLAAYYFSSTQNADQLTPLIEYLRIVGHRPQGEKWRWLAQAVYLARFRQGDLNKAIALAEELSGEWHPGRPLWMKQMPAFIMAAQGDREAAYKMMLDMLKGDTSSLRPGEVRFMRAYICTRLLDREAAARHPLCTSPP